MHHPHGPGKLHRPCCRPAASAAGRVSAAEAGCAGAGFHASRSFAAEVPAKRRGCRLVWSSQSASAGNAKACHRAARLVPVETSANAAGTANGHSHPSSTESARRPRRSEKGSGCNLGAVVATLHRCACAGRSSSRAGEAGSVVGCGEGCGEGCEAGSVAGCAEGCGEGYGEAWGTAACCPSWVEEISAVATPVCRLAAAETDLSVEATAAHLLVAASATTGHRLSLAGICPAAFAATSGHEESGRHAVVRTRCSRDCPLLLGSLRGLLGLPPFAPLARRASRRLFLCLCQPPALFLCLLPSRACRRDLLLSRPSPVCRSCLASHLYLLYRSCPVLRLRCLLAVEAVSGFGAPANESFQARHCDPALAPCWRWRGGGCHPRTRAPNTGCA